jgi:hypothetical protein
MSSHIPPTNHRALTLRSNGGILGMLKSDAQVTAAFDPKASGSSPSYKKFSAIWDTGATNSVITQKIIDVCQLKPIGMSRVNTANGPVDCPVFLVNLMLPSNVGIHHLRVTRGQISDDIDMLIGMDVITKGDFVITNFNGNTVFSFRIPSCECVDYVEQINRQRAVLGQPHTPINRAERRRLEREKPK